MLCPKQRIQRTPLIPCSSKLQNPIRTLPRARFAQAFFNLAIFSELGRAGEIHWQDDLNTWAGLVDPGYLIIDFEQKMEQDGKKILIIDSIKKKTGAPINLYQKN